LRNGARLCTVSRVTLRLERFDAVGAYLERAGPFLREREAAHNLILGITAGLTTNPEIWAAPPYLAAVTDDGAVVFAAIRTPPYNLVLSEIDDDAYLAPLADDLAAADLPGVMGPEPGVAAFAAAWSARTGRPHRRTMAERIFRLEQVRTVARPPGAMRPARESDRPLLEAWLGAFEAEAVPEEPSTDPGPAIDRYLAGGPRGLRLWDDGGPVALCGFGGPTPNGIRIGPVYTPPDRRRRGYATALVAAVSAERLAAGRRFCFLFTDLANPTSNHIYAEVGYEPIRDVAVHRFDRDRNRTAT
jgi:predicted GNAT family acetyltransferase